MLENNDVDHEAQQQAYMMVQLFGDDGKRAVLSICSNLLKNKQYISNKSAFVASACIKYKRSKESWYDGGH